ncbi:MAG: transposase [Kiritimatiellia bacterium]
MPRKPRIEYEGAVYHVMNRGDRGRKVFKDPLDYDLFDKATEQVCERTGWKIHAWALLPNHFHWLVETPEANLVAGMKWFLGAYSLRFNRRHGQRGHVFQGRYKALPVDAESEGYFDTLSTYIHLNPARAHMLGKDKPFDLGTYPYSSYSHYVGPKIKRPKRLEVRRVYGSLGLEDDSRARRRYAQYMRDRVYSLGKAEGRRAYWEEWQSIRYGWYLGTDTFREKLLGKLSETISGRQRRSYSGKAVRLHDEREAERIVKRGLEVAGVKDCELEGMAKGHELKCLLAAELHKHTMVNSGWISERLSMGTPANLSRHLKEAASNQKRSITALKTKLKKKLC